MTIAFFYVSGNIPVLKDFWYNIDKGRVIVLLIRFTKNAERPSGPRDMLSEQPFIIAIMSLVLKVTSESVEFNWMWSNDGIFPLSHVKVERKKVANFSLHSLSSKIFLSEFIMFILLLILRPSLLFMYK